MNVPGNSHIRAALYGRVSTQEQAQHGVSLDDQRERLKALATLEGWQIAGIYIDEGVSGGTDNRPQLQNLMFDAKAGCFDLVAVTKVDRFFRNTRLLLDYIHTLKQYNVSFIANAEGIDTRNAGIGNIILALLAAIAEWERERIGERVSDCRMHLKAKGQWSSGRTLYGFRFNNISKQMEICEPEAAAIRYAFSEFTRPEGSIGIVRLAEKMNETTYLTPRTFGKPIKNNFWTRGTILRMLHHPAYKGGPSELWKYKTPRIVEPEMWDMAQKRLSSNRHFKPSVATKTEFQGRLVCGLCGHRLAVGYNNANRRVYECPGRRKTNHLDGSERCTLPRFVAQELDQKLKAKVEELCNDPKLLLEYLKKYSDNLKSEQKRLSERLQPLDAEASQLRDDMVILDARLEMKRITPAVYKDRMSNLQKRIQDLEKRKSDLDPTLVREIKTNNIILGLYESSMEMLRAEISNSPASNTALTKTVNTITCIPNMHKILKDSYKLLRNETGVQDYHDNNIPDLVRNIFQYFIIYPDRFEIKGNINMRQSNTSSAGDIVHFVPGHSQNIGEEPFPEPVLPDDAQRPFHPGIGESGALTGFIDN